MEVITYIAAGDWGRSAYGPDWHGDTTNDFYELFSSWAGTESYTMTYDVYCLVDEEYRRELDEMSNVTVTSRPETCERGDAKYIDCGDGTKVLTDVCIPPNWYHSDADCEHCFFDSQRVRELSDGTLETSHQCAESEGPWIPVDRWEGVACGTLCDGGDLWSQKCVDGVCVKDALLVVNSPVCPQPDPDPEPSKSPWMLLTIAIIGLYLYLRG